MPVWLLTRCSEAVGRTLAEAVLAEGHRLVAVTSSGTQLDDLAARYQGRVLVLNLDVTREAGAAAAVALAVEGFGRLDVLVNQAGTGRVSSIEALSSAELRAQLDGDLFGHIILTKAVLPLMRAQRSGHIIHLSTIAGRLAQAGRGVSAAVMRGVEGFSEALAQEVGPVGIRVTTLVSGGLDGDGAESPGFENQCRGIGLGIGEIDASGSCASIVPHDPARMANIILQIAALTSPPLRLVLGRAALRNVARATLARIGSDRQWRQLSLSADTAGTGDDHRCDHQSIEWSPVAEPTAPNQFLAACLPFRASATTAPSAAQAEQTSSAT